MTCERDYIPEPWLSNYGTHQSDRPKSYKAKAFSADLLEASAGMLRRGYRCSSGPRRHPAGPGPASAPPPRTQRRLWATASLSSSLLFDALPGLSAGIPTGVN
eukprot:scaffold477161_cov27-Prasinocladus_malaysianus.AAC.1